MTGPSALAAQVQAIGCACLARTRWFPSQRSAARPWLVLAVLLGLSSASCARAPTGPDRNLVFIAAQADFPEAWSHDGRLIAFRRAYASNYGPPGIYLISPEGGSPRWLYPANLFWPARLRFSPDDRTLLAIDAFVLRLIDVETGVAREPMYTNSAVVHAEWTADGRKLLYYRVHYGLPDVPADSSWLHLLDLDAGTSTSLPLDGRLVSLESMRRGPDGRIAAIEHLSFSDRLVLVDVASRHCEIVLDTQTLKQYRNPQWWWRPSRSRASIVFEMAQPVYVGWTINADGTDLRQIPIGWHVFRLMSPDGSRIVRDGTDPITRVGVLGISSVDDLSGASYRQLTRFSLPAGTPAASYGPRSIASSSQMP